MDNTFIRLLKLELKKATKNTFFLITFIIACIFSLLSALYMIDTYVSTTQSINHIASGSNPMTQAFSLYNHWIGGEASSLGYTLFFTLLPLMATLPYSWSYYTENKNGYVKSVVLRSGKFQYFLSKYIATFIAGGLVVLIPLVFNFILVACFVPAITPTTFYPIYYAIGFNSLWSSLFYTKPLIFIILYLTLDFLFSGLFATMGLAISFFIKNRIAIILAPFFLILILHYSRTFFKYKYYNEISPLHYLHATSIENYANGSVIAVQGLIFFLLTFGITMGLGVKREIF